MSLKIRAGHNYHYIDLETDHNWIHASNTIGQDVCKAL